MKQCMAKLSIPPDLSGFDNEIFKNEVNSPSKYFESSSNKINIKETNF